MILLLNLTFVSVFFQIQQIPIWPLPKTSKIWPLLQATQQLFDAK